MPELMTVHDIMLAAGNAAFNEARAAAIRLAEQFECGAFPNMTPADALHMLAAALPHAGAVSWDIVFEAISGRGASPACARQFDRARPCNGM